MYAIKMYGKEKLIHSLAIEYLNKLFPDYIEYDLPFEIIEYIITFLIDIREEYWPSGSLRFSEIRVNELLHGTAKKYNNLGLIQYSKPYNFGLLHGTVYTYFGDKSTIDCYINGLRQGRSEIKNSFQTIKVSHYLNNEKHGKTAAWYCNGFFKYEKNYKNGILHGEYAEYYDNGKFRIITNYNEGYINGFYKFREQSYSDEYSVSEYKNGIVTGIIYTCRDSVTNFNFGG